MKPTLTKGAEDILTKLNNGELTPAQFHNKKNYAKRCMNLQLLVDLATAWEVFRCENP